MKNDFNLIGGITIRQIINSIPMFDAMLEDFWILANDYIPKDILHNDEQNQQFVASIRTNIWFRNQQNIKCYNNNGLSISYRIVDDRLQSLSISNCSGQQLFSLSDK